MKKGSLTQKKITTYWWWRSSGYSTYEISKPSKHPFSRAAKQFTQHPSVARNTGNSFLWDLCGYQGTVSSRYHRQLLLSVKLHHSPRNLAWCIPQYWQWQWLQWGVVLWMGSVHHFEIPCMSQAKFGESQLSGCLWRTQQTQVLSEGAVVNMTRRNIHRYL